jgi:hypothetical protein
LFISLPTGEAWSRRACLRFPGVRRGFSLEVSPGLKFFGFNLCPAFDFKDPNIGITIGVGPGVICGDGGPLRFFEELIIGVERDSAEFWYMNAGRRTLVGFLE